MSVTWIMQERKQVAVSTTVKQIKHQGTGKSLSKSSPLSQRFPNFFDCTYLSVKRFCTHNVCTFIYKSYNSNTEVPIFSSHSQMDDLAHLGYRYPTSETTALTSQDQTENITQEKRTLPFQRFREGRPRLVVTLVLLNGFIIIWAL